MVEMVMSTDRYIYQSIYHNLYENMGPVFLTLTQPFACFRPLMTTVIQLRYHLPIFCRLTMLTQFSTYHETKDTNLTKCMY